MSITTATFNDVENALLNLMTLAENDPKLEESLGKKLAQAVDSLTIKDSITKDLNQAYSNAEKKWALNMAKKLNGCTSDNMLEKVKEYVLAADRYNHHLKDNQEKVERWFSGKFSVADNADSELLAA